ncbi:recombinase RecT [Neorhizobium sp. LjRoot104]|uniref:recombinase RecT n=1 Tax=Neorhizobium sp. LjRoot104 TaxID=3342254 RepID=UPI003ECECD84
MNAPVTQEFRPPALAGGGNVMAIVPQTFEETFRISRAVVSAGLAPAALVGKKTGDEAASAVAVAIMSGAELGLKPMVALRSFTVINGRPALYGDGLINVVRQSGKVAYLRTGCEMRDGEMVGWCEAKRNDTSEDKRVEFSQADAVRAGLWQSDALIRKQVWENGQKIWKNDQPNDSPWFRFPQRMLAWRAAGYCLRELFGDVLGGIRDEYEAREIADAEEMRDITPRQPPVPPKPPAPPEPPAEVIENEPTEQVPEEGEFDAAGYFEELETALAGAMDEATIEEVWTGFDPGATFDGEDVNLDIAQKIKDRRLAQISAASAE